MESCPSLAIVTFLSLFINVGIGIYWYIKKLQKYPAELTDYQPALVDQDANSDHVSL